MNSYTVYQIDSFTKEKFKGNPAGVVVNADGLSDKQMQLIARELNNSETAFILSSNSSEYDLEIRYFTPTIEVPICGHATIAAMYARALENSSESATLHVKTQVGILPFETIKENGDYKIVMTQGTIEIDQSFSDKNQQALLTALGLGESDIDNRCPVQIVSAGHSKVMIGITQKHILNNMKPDLSALSNLSTIINCNGYYVFTLESDEDDILVHGRMFAPAIGINEDPVTGNANGPLGAYLVHNQIVKPRGNQFHFKGKQGEAIGREGIVDVFIDIKDEKPERIKIMGDARVVFKTEIVI
jgi:PhzF family phenazine biosynthesis protein